jgi:hypothetical protein
LKNEDLARGLGMSKTSVFKSLREGKIERHSSAIKPYLTDENKKTRVQHALNMSEPSSIPHQPVFRLMYNVVHAGEKWYYITRKTQNSIVYQVRKGLVGLARTKITYRK